MAPLKEPMQIRKIMGHKSKHHHDEHHHDKHDPTHRHHKQGHDKDGSKKNHHKHGHGKKWDAAKKSHASLEPSSHGKPGKKHASKAAKGKKALESVKHGRHGKDKKLLKHLPADIKNDLRLLEDRAAFGKGKDAAKSMVKEAKRTGNASVILETQNCPHCGKHCPLTSPRCGKGKELRKSLLAS